MPEAARGAIQRVAPAKVNLSLRVVGRHADGYHELDGLTAFADLGDIVTVRPAGGVMLDVVGPFAGTLAQEGDNLVLRAARALSEAVGRSPGAHIVLDKQLPVAAGLGGGSADAAATLQALAALWDVAVPEARLRVLALDLGADVPVCLLGRAAFVSGIGERIGPAPHLPAAWLVLANPGVELSTSDVFRRHGQAGTPHAPPAMRWEAPPRDAVELARYLTRDGNDLEASATALRPEIGAVLVALAEQPGCLLARMSGSGATCFGLFAEAGGAEAVAAQLAATRPEWWVRAARLAG